MNRAHPGAPCPDATPAPRPPPVIQGAPIDARKLALARRFRREPTPAEAAAWQLLRGRRILGLKFRRQHVIAGFIVDFYCASLRLVLELDGGIHDHPVQAENDASPPQHASPGFISAFSCASLPLVPELDGAIHAPPVQAEYDAIRTQILSTLA